MHFKKTGLRCWVFVAVSMCLFVMLGCTSTKPSNEKVETRQVAAAAPVNAGPDVDLNCVIDHLQKPPESFHYMFKDDSDSPWSEQADVTPQMIDGSFKSNYMPGPVTIHGAPQEIPHQYQWAIGRMASLFALVRGTSAMANEGTENGVNGYNTTKLSIDTTRATATEQGLYTSTLGPGGFEKGTVWVIQDGCPVKLAIDEELHSKDGKVLGKAHYEEAMIKK
jgi:hypothetical protein